MTAIWALLSAGGIGAGLALKDPVQEFFEYITILLDKPFQKGEFIKSGDILGMVERVGVRSSRIRSINGEVIVISNSALTKRIISNYAQMTQRRLVHKLGVVYETSPSLMKMIPKIIEKIIEETNDASFDRCHFTDFGDFSLNFELVYYIPTNDYLAAMEAQQSINLRIIEEFAVNNIEFAFPTQTLNIESNKAK
jgi:small-conductance mechanosensitive channel